MSYYGNSWSGRFKEDPTPRGWVYFILAETCRELKIGVSGNLKNRLLTLKAESGGERLHLLGLVRGDERTERAFHLRFKHLRVGERGEWFYEAEELLRCIQEEAQEELRRYQEVVDPQIMVYLYNLSELRRIGLMMLRAAAHAKRTDIRTHTDDWEILFG